VRQREEVSMNDTWRGIIPIFLLLMLATITVNAAFVEECPNVMSFSPEKRLKGPVKTFKEQLVDISHGESGTIVSTDIETCSHVIFSYFSTKPISGNLYSSHGAKSRHSLG
jgi:hypothetical protein